MKRRTLITSALLAAPVAAIAPLIKLDGVPVETNRRPKYVEAVDQLTDYSLATDAMRFSISLRKNSRVIDIIPVPDTPQITHLTVLAFHRYMSDLSDRAAVDGYNDILDITYAAPTYRLTDDIIAMNDGWTLTPRAKDILVGGIEENGVRYSSIKVLGKVDYRLTRNIKVSTEDGTTYPYHKAGYARIPVNPMSKRVTVEYESYKNAHSVYNTATNELDIVRGLWVPQNYNMDMGLGMTVIPIFSMG